MRFDRLVMGLGALAGSGLAVRRLRRGRRRIDFAGRTAVVTGGSRGLGLVLARLLVAEGADVTLVARTGRDLEVACEELGRQGRVVTSVATDVAAPGAMNSVVERVMEQHGRLDVLINCAGTIQVGPIEHMTSFDFERAMATHFWGPLFGMQAAIRVMRRQGAGRIVNISSIGGCVAVPHMVPYVASKFALRGLSMAVGDEVARDGIRVTTVCPGLLRTGSHVNIEIKGRHQAEYAWFAAANAMPLLSMGAERAAHKILSACRHGDRTLNVGVPTKIAVAADALAPELVSDAMALANRFLPDPAPLLAEARTGWESRSRWAPSLLTRRSDRAVAHNNELRGHAPEELTRRHPDPAGHRSIE
jgi:NAD(P)-dependent dehydrogenase (short-subunit alcohol dehydrogenase family)